ncbi:MAG: hypothetical protein QFX40_01010 [Archaeoglobales archaeon]|nr:hypothetical protein [Archaeoglobales archaeon]
MKYRQITSTTKQLFSRISPSLRAKLIHILLNSIRTKDRENFVFELLRNLNTINDSKKEDLAEMLEEILFLDDKEFEKVAYSIILGIMSAGSKRED